MKADQLLDKPADVIAHRFEDGMVVYVGDNDRFLGLDSMGAVIWEHLCSHGTVNTVVETMLLEYDIDEHTLREDVESLCRQMIECGALKPKHDGEKGKKEIGI